MKALVRELAVCFHMVSVFTSGVVTLEGSGEGLLFIGGLMAAAIHTEHTYSTYCKLYFLNLPNIWVIGHASFQYRSLTG